MITWYISSQMWPGAQIWGNPKLAFFVYYKGTDAPGKNVNSTKGMKLKSPNPHSPVSVTPCPPPLSLSRNHGGLAACVMMHLLLFGQQLSICNCIYTHFSLPVFPYKCQRFSHRDTHGSIIYSNKNTRNYFNLHQEKTRKLGCMYATQNSRPIKR